MPPRVRMFAGPNGSGKSTLLNGLAGAKCFRPGYVLNPDVLEAQLNASRRLDFVALGLKVDDQMLIDFIQAHPLGVKIGKYPGRTQNNIFLLEQSLEPGYFVAVLCDFLRRQWLKAGKSFTFETVMSSADKPQFLGEARQLGCRTYLYFVCTRTPSINQSRVRSRVQEGGHSVPPEKIHERYTRSLSLLKLAVANASRAYIFDNSGAGHQFIAEFENNRVCRISPNSPRWLFDYLLD